MRTAAELKYEDGRRRELSVMRTRAEHRRKQNIYSKMLAVSPEL